MKCAAGMTPKRELANPDHGRPSGASASGRHQPTTVFSADSLGHLPAQAEPNSSAKDCDPVAVGVEDAAQERAQQQASPAAGWAAIGGHVVLDVLAWRTAPATGVPRPEQALTTDVDECFDPRTRGRRVWISPVHRTVGWSDLVRPRLLPAHRPPRPPAALGGLSPAR